MLTRFYARSLAPLAALAEWGARMLEEAARRLRRCPDCGRSRFYGCPCVGQS